MTRIFLFLLFFVLLTADMLGLNKGLAPGLSVKNAFLYLIFASIAVEAALARNRRLELLSVFVPYVLCILYAILTWSVILLLDVYPDYRAFSALISLKGGLADHVLVFIVFFYGVLNAKDALWLLKMIIWTVLAANFVGVVDDLGLLNLGLVEERIDGRAVGPIGEPNQYAAFLALFLPAAFALALIENGLRRIMAILGLGVSVLAFLMTVSRGGIVGVIGGAVLGALFLRKYVSGKAVLLTLGGFTIFTIIAVAALYVAGYGDLLYERILDRSTAGTAFEASSGRTLLWGALLEKMFEQPVSLITGYGWAAYSNMREFFLSPHNTYLKVYFELGAIGLSLILLTFANVLRVARKGLSRAQSEESLMLYAFVFGLVGILIAMIFVDIASPWLFLWAYVGIAMRLSVPQYGAETSGAEGPAALGVRRKSGNFARPA